MIEKRVTRSNLIGCIKVLKKHPHNGAVITSPTPLLHSPFSTPPLSSRRSSLSRLLHDKYVGSHCQKSHCQSYCRASKGRQEAPNARPGASHFVSEHIPEYSYGVATPKIISLDVLSKTTKHGVLQSSTVTRVGMGRGLGGGSHGSVRIGPC